MKHRLFLFLFPFLSLSFLIVPACKDKRSDVELFQEGPVRISLSAENTKGYQPLYVSFSAYLETKDSVFSDEITEVKWVIKGPRGRKNEIIQESHNYQEGAENKEDFFYWDYHFQVPGKYKVWLVLNKGKYKSNYIPVSVYEKPEGARIR